jgi:hypothetical protein
MSSIDNCKVTRKVGNEEVDVITSPTSAVLNNDLSPSMNIVVTGGTRVADQLKKNNGGYKITGKVGTKEREFRGLKCDDAGNPAKFKKP